MERASAEVIAALLTPTPRRRRHQQPVFGIARPSTIGRRKPRCQCGECRECRENARWERIFTEKFADPNYYALRIPSAVSPLTSL